MNLLFNFFMKRTPIPGFRDRGFVGTRGLGTNRDHPTAAKTRPSPCERYPTAARASQQQPRPGASQASLARPSSAQLRPAQADPRQPKPAQTAQNQLEDSPEPARSQPKHPRNQPRSAKASPDSSDKQKNHIYIYIHTSPPNTHTQQRPKTT